MKPIYIFLYVLTLCLGSCRKDWLEIKPDKKLTIPSRTADLWALLDNTYIMNNNSAGSLPEFAEIGADNYFLPDQTWSTLSSALLIAKNAYIFTSDVFQGARSDWYWNVAYQRIFYTNIVLDGIPGLEDAAETTDEVNELKGTALFHRAFNFFWLAQMFAPPYSPSTASQLPGIALRLHSDLNIKTQRAGMQETYDQILKDLEEALPLLPASASFTTRPTKASAHALLARTYLVMQDYNNSLLHADSCLFLHNTLMDYNNISSAPTFPFVPYNTEVLFHDQNPTSIFATTRARVDTLFMASFGSGDLRRSRFFKPQGVYFSFNGGYTGGTPIFAGLATDEMWLTRAECYARLGELAKAMADLNYLLERRWASGSFTPLSAATKEEAVSIILNERRKELCFRGLRWIDLRRLNLEPAFQVTVKRLIAGQEYILAPNSLNYTYPIPKDIISMTGMSQNARE